MAHRTSKSRRGAIPKADVPPLDAVDRALQLLVLLHEEGRVGVTQVSDRFGVSLSAAHRLLSALVYRGFAVQDDDRRYCSGPKLTSVLSRAS
jgi:IclR family transcriptional regulator, acetate operon repressor